MAAAAEAALFLAMVEGSFWPAIATVGVPGIHQDTAYAHHQSLLQDKEREIGNTVYSPN